MVRRSNVLAGVGYLVVIALVLGSCVLAYRKDLPWQHAATVTVETRAAGLALNAHSDVKFQGAIVGEVRTVRSDGRQASVELAIDPDRLAFLPRDVDAAIVPKTLFGEQYVDLRPGPKPSAQRLAAGDVVEASDESVELGAVYARLVPLLKAVQPERLSTVLNALSRGLAGRGATLGAAFRDLDAVLTQVQPHLDTAARDLELLADTADVYADAAPDLRRVLSSVSHLSTDLLVPHEQSLAAFLDQTGATSDDLGTFLDRAGVPLVQINGRSRSVVALLHAFRSMLPCTVKGLERLDVLGSQAIGGGGPFTRLTVDVIASRPGYDAPRDLPTSPASDANSSRLPSVLPGSGPHCPQFRPEVMQLSLRKPTKAGASAASTSSDQPVPVLSQAVYEAQQAMARLLAADSLGVPVDRLPPVTGLLMGPLVTDGAVSVR